MALGKSDVMLVIDLAGGVVVSGTVKDFLNREHFSAPSNKNFSLFNVFCGEYSGLRDGGLFYDQTRV